MKRNFILAGLIFLLLCVPGFALEVPERPDGRVTDKTGTLSGGEIAALEQKLATFERETTNQIAVLLIPSLAGDSLEDYSIRLAEKWKIGQKGKNNGAILLVVKNDRKLRIEVGYGLEGALPDALAGSIIRNEIAPRFKEGQFYGGIDAGVTAIMAATKGEYKAPKRRRTRVYPGSLCCPSSSFWPFSPSTSWDESGTIIRGGPGAGGLEGASSGADFRAGVTAAAAFPEEVGILAAAEPAATGNGTQMNADFQDFKHKELTERIIKIFYRVYSKLGYGFLEKVYENALMLELKKEGIPAVAQSPIKVLYEGEVLGEYFADILVADKVIVEIKAANRLVEENEAQLLNYLKGTRIEVGLLLNFGAKPEVRRKAFDNVRK